MAGYCGNSVEGKSGRRQSRSHNQIGLTGSPYVSAADEEGAFKSSRKSDDACTANMEGASD